MKSIAVALLAFVACAFAKAQIVYPTPISPITIAADAVPILTTGCPADLVSIPVPFPAGTRFRIVGSSNVISSSTAICSSMSAYSLATGLALYDASGGTGVVLSTGFSLNFGTVGQALAIYPFNIAVSTSSAIVIRQPYNSQYGGKIDFSFTLVPCP